MSKLPFLLLFLIFMSLNGCGLYKKVDARKVSPNVNERAETNIKEGKGYKIFDAKRNIMGGGAFQFANSNGLWRASLDVIDFMPLSSVNYSGGIIITDWYSENNNPNESIKISIRFLTNEIRSDSLQIKVFKKECFDGLKNCITEEIDGVIIPELTRKILKTATLYKNEKKEKKE